MAQPAVIHEASWLMNHLFGLAMIDKNQNVMFWFHKFLLSLIR